ncbi:MAG: hypothetical protein AAFU85_13660 [Planctomycetota bacterium]
MADSSAENASRNVLWLSAEIPVYCIDVSDGHAMVGTGRPSHVTRRTSRLEFASDGSDQYYDSENVQTAGVKKGNDRPEPPDDRA